MKEYPSLKSGFGDISGANDVFLTNFKVILSDKLGDKVGRNRIFRPVSVFIRASQSTVMCSVSGKRFFFFLN